MSKKRATIFMTLLLVIPLFLISFSQIASAQDRVGCCIETNNNNYCVDYTYESQCKANQFHNGVCSALPDCKPITCATPNGCLFNYPKLRCEKELGSISLQAMPAVCMQGCCGIANRGYGVMTKKECQDKTTILLGYELNQMTFIEGLTNERECDLRFAASDRGCCYLGAATCSYETRGECENAGGIFRQGIYCSQILECEAEANASRNCGILPGDKNKLCEFDSLGNQEQCWHECLINDEYCALNNTNPRNAFPECRSTTCQIETGLFHQKMTSNFGDKSRFTFGGDEPLVESIPFTETILNGNSKCFNFYTSNDKNNPSIEVGIAVGKSTGLQNNKIVCNYGELQIFGLGADRNTICEDKIDNHAVTKTNRWERCSDCGKGRKILDIIGEYFSAGVTYMDIGSMFGHSIGFGGLLEDLGTYCTNDSCENLGDCIYHAEFYSFGGERGLLDTRSKEEQLGSGTLAINARDIGASCSPKYPPGTTTTCGLCGGGGDSFFNMCEQKECLRLGNCEFERNGPIQQGFIGTTYALGLAVSAKFNVIPVYVFGDCLISSGGVGFPICYAKGIGEETAELLLTPAKAVFESVFGTIKIGSFIGQNIAQGAYSQAMSKINLLK